jgi:hypothetical protein
MSMKTAPQVPVIRTSYMRSYYEVSNRIAFRRSINGHEFFGVACKAMAAEPAHDRHSTRQRVAQFAGIVSAWSKYRHQISKSYGRERALSLILRAGNSVTPNLALAFVETCIYSDSKPTLLVLERRILCGWKSARRLISGSFEQLSTSLHRLAVLWHARRVR